MMVKSRKVIKMTRIISRKNITHAKEIDFVRHFVRIKEIINYRLYLFYYRLYSA